MLELSEYRKLCINSPYNTSYSKKNVLKLYQLDEENTVFAGV